MIEDKKKGGSTGGESWVPKEKEKKKKEKDFFSNEQGTDLTAAVIFHIEIRADAMTVLAELKFPVLDKLMGGFDEIETGGKKYKLKRRTSSAKGISLEYQEVK